MTKWYRKRMRDDALRTFQLEKISEEEAMQMTEEDFLAFSQGVRFKLFSKFPLAPCMKSVADWKVKKLTNKELKQAAKDWYEDSVTAEAFYGHISGWDVSETTDMSNLFEDMKDFDEDISRWDVSNVQNMAWMFCNAEKFSDNIGSWNTANVQKCRACSWVLWLFL
eukprot:CAMPEP_0182453466 /NCGR_PEP_ID=MMETSP1319-20130603/516_1 /TAXON_ID=172717 /ORGANISM="Bolidomonas pacifica, Strain RCC208" /LENGTH=165 /DNA_ID=CAMNT_0024651401 /DNA_START=614 /DNA_END=1111 /DNA_ORIENTATION=+